MFVTNVKVRSAFVRGFMFLMFYAGYRVLSGMQTRMAVLPPGRLCLGAYLLHPFLYVCVYAVRVLEFRAHLHRHMSNACIDICPMPGFTPVCVYVCGSAVRT